MGPLAAYETKKYRLEYCFIDIPNDDGNFEKTVNSVTFMWNPQENELRPDTFDLRELTE